MGLFRDPDASLSLESLLSCVRSLLLHAMQCVTFQRTGNSCWAPVDSWPGVRTCSEISPSSALRDGNALLPHASSLLHYCIFPSQEAHACGDPWGLLQGRAGNSCCIPDATRAAPGILEPSAG